MIHNEFRHNGHNIARRSLRQKPMQGGCPSGEHTTLVLSVSWILQDITRPQVTDYAAQVVLSAFIPETVGYRDYMTAVQTANTKWRS